MAESFSRYDIYTVTGSIYCYRDTNVLRNRLGIRDNQQLRIVEADITAVRQISVDFAGRLLTIISVI